MKMFLPRKVFGRSNRASKMADPGPNSSVVRLTAQRAAKEAVLGNNDGLSA
jgi:hypothetical protein